MNLINKAFYLLLLGFLVVDIFPQEQSYVSINGNINNSFTKRCIYNVTAIPSLRNNQSAEVLDSIICLFLGGEKIKIAYYYNHDLSLNYFISADWFNDKWINSDKHTNTYDSDGNLVSVLWEWFNGSIQEWLKDAKDMYNYDSLGNQINFLHQNYVGQEFINVFRYEYFYDSSKNMTLSLGESWNNGAWVNDVKAMFTYNKANKKDTALFQFWRNDQWVNHQLNIFEYDEKLNVITNLSKRWQENNWINYGMGTYEYDYNNNEVLFVWKIANNNNWENCFRIFDEYNDKNNVIHLYGEEWVNGDWIPENEPLIVKNPDGILFGYIAKEIFLYYSPPASVGNEKNIANGFNLFQNYPNPFNPATKIKFSIPKSEVVQIKVYDIFGKEVEKLLGEYTEAGNYEVEFDASNLPSGVYFYRMLCGSYSETKKMILLR